MALAGETGRSRSQFAHGTEDSREGDAGSSRLVCCAVRRAQAGDREAFAFLYARFADEVRGCLRDIVDDEHEAQEATRQVFAKLTLAIGEHDEREAPFCTWLLRLARDLTLEHARQRAASPLPALRERRLLRARRQPACDPAAVEVG
jgi:DNA-directed RNA polymerase specialized sigma24 family protein